MGKTGKLYMRHCKIHFRTRFYLYLHNFTFCRTFVVILCTHGHRACFPAYQQSNPYLSIPKRGLFDLSAACRPEKCRRRQSPRHRVAYASRLLVHQTLLTTSINDKLQREGNTKNTIPAQPYGQPRAHSYARSYNLARRQTIICR